MSEATCSQRDAASLISNLSGYTVIDAVDRLLGGRREVVRTDAQDQGCPCCGVISDAAACLDFAAGQGAPGGDVVEVVVRKPRWACAERACSRRSSCKVVIHGSTRFQALVQGSRKNLTVRIRCSSMPRGRTRMSSTADSVITAVLMVAWTVHHAIANAPATSSTARPEAITASRTAARSWGRHREESDGLATINRSGRPRQHGCIRALPRRDCQC